MADRPAASVQVVHDTLAVCAGCRQIVSIVRRLRVIMYLSLRCTLLVQQLCLQLWRQPTSSMRAGSSVSCSWHTRWLSCCPFAARGICGGCVLCVVFVVAGDAGITRAQSQRTTIILYRRMRVITGRVEDPLVGRYGGCIDRARSPEEPYHIIIICWIIIIYLCMFNTINIYLFVPPSERS